MIEHWYEYLPAAWFTAEGRWAVLLTVVLLMGAAFAVGYWLGRRGH